MIPNDLCASRQVVGGKCSGLVTYTIPADTYQPGSHAVIPVGTTTFYRRSTNGDLCRTTQHNWNMSHSLPNHGTSISMTNKDRPGFHDSFDLCASKNCFAHIVSVTVTEQSVCARILRQGIVSLLFSAFIVRMNAKWLRILI